MGLKSFCDETKPVTDAAVDVEDAGFEEIAVQKKCVSDHNIKNALFGIFGAFLFALAGGALWYLVYQTGFIVGTAGVVTIVLALCGYALFGNGLSRFGIVVSIIATVAVLFFAEYCCVAKDIFDTFQYWYTTGKTDNTLTFIQSMRLLFNLMNEKGFRAFGIDLIVGYALSAFACVFYFVRRRKA